MFQVSEQSLKFRWWQPRQKNLMSHGWNRRCSRLTSALVPHVRASLNISRLRSVQFVFLSNEIPNVKTCLDSVVGLAKCTITVNAILIRHKKCGLNSMLCWDGVIIMKSPRGPSRSTNTLINESEAINGSIITGYPFNVFWDGDKVDFLQVGSTPREEVI